MTVPSALKPHCRPNYNEVPPIVIIVSEALLNFSSETLTVNRLLGPEVCNHHHTTVIDFNSIAPTIMQKALKDVLLKQSRHSKNFRFPRATMLHNISRVGDIRSAISSLEFLCRRTEGIGEPIKRASRTSKKTQDSEELTSTEKEALDLVTHREASLGIFHAVGKIVYNKREDKNIAADVDGLAATPDHLIRHDRPKVPQVSVNELVDATGTDIQTFVYALHENYVPSCNGPSFTEYLGGCTEALSDSDALCFSRDNARRSWAGARAGISGANAGTDVIRQQDISYQVATRGLLFSLPYPVKRQATTGGRVNEAHKLSFPASLRLSYDTEEVESLLNLWLNKALHQATQSTSGLGKHGGDTRTRATGDCNGAQRPIVTVVSRSDMLLYQLPYMARMPWNRPYLPELKRLVEMRGLDSEYETLGDQDDFPYHYHPGTGPRASDGASLIMLSHEKYADGAEEGGLLLSDEDIVDD
ncbi:putative cell cycle checkpoint protein Rad17 [Aspergillus affinis]|uniref:putative cell cycle checkpoint protein Rad17 n=1 Tax=Aspergillus affinis TaxID=1070780 RepID=UPI0022FE9D1D|nr:Rad17-domain-containing protein [Aspergillus affinis]KAI9039737.1 Rad17-domain-containing protein [Aspergillus affinis]